MRSSFRLLLLAAWFGLLAGILEIVIVQLALRSGVAVRLSADYVWMAPAADLLFAVLATLLVFLLAAWRPRLDRTAMVLGVLCALLVASAVFYYEALHRGAVLLLAAGIGSQASRLARYAKVRALFRLVPATLLAMAVLVAWFAVSVRRGARDAAAAPGSAGAPGGGMSVLLLILDTVREPSPTPALDAFAARGVRFDLAVAAAPWTLPSHASFFTGRTPSQHRANWGVSLDRTFPTLAEYLSSRGYATAGFVGNLQFATRASGLARGFVHYDDYQVNLGQTLVSSSIGRVLTGTTWIRRVIGYHELANRRNAEDVAGDFLRWQARQQGRPYFAFVNFFDAHEPYFPEGYSGSMLWPGPRWYRYEHGVGLHTGANAWLAEKWTLTPPQIPIHAGAYQRAVGSADAAAGRLLAELERRGGLEHTMVIVASDHGEQLGEHKLFEHINSLYLPALHVPLVIVAPGLPRGVRVPGAVSLMDLPATVVDLLGVGAGAPFPGRSLAPHWTGAAAGDTAYSELQRGLVRQGWYPIGKGDRMFSLITSEHHYIRNGDGSEELYDIKADPGELRNVVGEGSYQPVLTQLRASLSARALAP